MLINAGQANAATVSVNKNHIGPTRQHLLWNLYGNSILGAWYWLIFSKWLPVRVILAIRMQLIVHMLLPRQGPALLAVYSQWKSFDGYICLTALLLLQLLNVSTDDILIQSTGVIGQRIKKVHDDMSSMQWLISYLFPSSILALVWHYIVQCLSDICPLVLQEALLNSLPRLVGSLSSSVQG